MLGCIGVVYGDIGTSPLYAMRESLHAAGTDGLVREDVLGIVSLLLWTLILIVSVKYVLLIMRADNHGEGGTLSLVALIQQALRRRPAWLLGLGMVGISLFFGDAVITPAMSVLSAVEGMELVFPAFSAFVVPATLIIIVAGSVRAIRRNRPFPLHPLLDGHNYIICKDKSLAARFAGDQPGKIELSRLV